MPAQLTAEQLDHLRWLEKQGGSGIIDKFGRVMAGGEVAPRNSFPAWMNLFAYGYVIGARGRVTVSSIGRNMIDMHAEKKQLDPLRRHY